jgi:hypothetical protein
MWIVKTERFTSFLNTVLINLLLPPSNLIFMKWFPFQQ